MSESHHDAATSNTMEEISVARVDPNEPESLLFALCQPPESDTPLPVPATPPPLPPDHHPANPFRAPLPDPTLVAAVHTWLTSRSTSPEDIPTGLAFLKCAGLKDNGGIRSRVKLFRTTLHLFGLPLSELPSLDDLRQYRNHPRVYASFAFLANFIDAEGWNAALRDAGASQPTDWRDAMVEEPWSGDTTAREILKLFGDCTVVVVGSQGSGKSATVGTIINRPAIPASHALSYITPEEYMTAEEKNKVDKLRHLAHINWPDLPLERNLCTGSDSVERCHVKLDGKVLSFIELPSLDAFEAGLDEMGGRIEIQYGSFENVVKDLQGERPNLLLLVERLDDINEKRLKQQMGFVQRLFGRSVYSRMVVVLTHGESLPGEKSYEVWAYGQISRVERVLRKFTRDLKPVPVVAMENSYNCRVVSGRRVLPDGTDFVQKFLEEVTKIAEEVPEGTELRPLPTQRWWEKYVLVLLFSLVVSRIR